jgi:hypothetical protein
VKAKMHKPFEKMKHTEAIRFFNDLLLDLRLQLDERESRYPINRKRLEEADKHMWDIMSCKEPLFYRMNKILEEGQKYIGGK